MYISGVKISRVGRSFSVMWVKLVSRSIFYAGLNFFFCICQSENIDIGSMS